MKKADSEGALDAELYLKYSDINVAVTGASGFIGYSLCKILLSNTTARVYSIRRKEISDENNKRYSDLLSSNRFVDIDIRNEDRYQELVRGKPVVFFHLASYGVDSKQVDFNTLIDGNIEFTRVIADLALEVNGLLIHTSTCYEYAESSNIINEEHCLEPKSLYGAFKASVSMILNNYCKIKNIRYVSLRLFGVYGPFEGPHKLIPQLISSSLTGRRIQLTSGSQVRDYTFIHDVVRAYLMVGLRSDLNTQIFNVCSGAGIAIKDLVYQLFKINRLDTDVLSFGSIEMTSNDFNSVVGDPSKIKDIIGWEPRYSLNDGLRETYVSYEKKFNET